MAVKLIEWPEILENTFVADVEIQLSETEDPDTRTITVRYRDPVRNAESSNE